MKKLVSLLCVFAAATCLLSACGGVPSGSCDLGDFGCYDNWACNCGFDSQWYCDNCGALIGVTCQELDLVALCSAI